MRDMVTQVLSRPASPPTTTTATTFDTQVTHGQTVDATVCLSCRHLCDLLDGSGFGTHRLPVSALVGVGGRRSRSVVKNSDPIPTNFSNGPNADTRRRAKSS